MKDELHLIRPIPKRTVRSKFARLSYGSFHCHDVLMKLPSASFRNAADAYVVTSAGLSDDDSMSSVSRQRSSVEDASDSVNTKDEPLHVFCMSTWSFAAKGRRYW